MFSNKDSRQVIQMLQDIKFHIMEGDTDNLEKIIQSYILDVKGNTTKIKNKNKNLVDYRKDEVFLLSCDEYLKYKDIILSTQSTETAFWLIDTCSRGDMAYTIDATGSIRQTRISNKHIKIRPAITLDTMEYKPGELIIKYALPWIVLDTGLAFANAPVWNSIFDSESNDYKNSEIRKTLKYWLSRQKEISKPSDTWLSPDCECDQDCKSCTMCCDTCRYITNEENTEPCKSCKMAFSCNYEGLPCNYKKQIKKK